MMPILAQTASIVVCVHGLYMNGHDMALLRRRLRQEGFQPVQFSYRTVKNSVAENAARLAAFVGELDSDAVHFVGHSLGGLVIRRLFTDFADLPAGRIVTLGTPHLGSEVARSLEASLAGRFMLGRSLEQGLLGNLPPWRGQRELGSIAGSLSFGAGWVVADLPRPNDGTVAVCETELPNMTDHITFPVSHMALLFSSGVAREVCHFLEHGRFGH
jgi:pimeloyl-ACP methyl ester carboxylesterase